MESDCLDGSDEVGCCKYSSMHRYALYTEIKEVFGSETIMLLCTFAFGM
jgi:hypothetical protein